MASVTGDPLAFAVAVANAAIAYEFCRLQLRQLRRQLDSADRYYQMYRRQRALYRSVFQTGQSFDNPADGPAINGVLYSQSSGAERSLVNEARSEIPYSARYLFQQNDVGARQGDYLTQILYHFNATPTAVTRKHERMQLKPDPNSLVYLALTAIATNVDGLNYWYRFEEYREIVERERRFEHLTSAMQFSLKRGVAVANGAGMALDQLGNARQRMADFYGKASNNFGGMAGFALQRSFAAGDVPRVGPKMRGPEIDSRLGRAGFDMDANIASAQEWSTLDMGARNDRMVENKRRYQIADHQ